jgi:calcium/calmodulin-dependent protein kinase I
MVAAFSTEDDDSNIKIADFGFAKNIKDLTPKETACGTPGYVAPEILRGDGYGTEVDIWSMGVICYVLLAGYPPFYDEDQKKLFKKIKEGRYYFHDEYWSNTSPEAMDLIKMMLCVDQQKRWSADQLLQHQWITMGDDALLGKSLVDSIVTMRKFNARRRLVRII